MRQTIQPRSGTAFTIKKGELLKVIDPEGEQVADLYAFNEHDKEEFISSGRSLDYNESIQFKKKFRLSGVSTLELWLNLANQITLTRLYELYNFINKKSLKVPKDDINIFEVNLTNINKTLVFNANYIQEKCHALNFNKQFQNSLS